MVVLRERHEGGIATQRGAGRQRGDVAASHGHDCGFGRGGGPVGNAGL